MKSPAGAGLPQVLCIGETMALVAPADGRPLAETGRVDLELGGAESNVARYLADLGVHAAWLSALGDDPLGERIVRELGSSGVDVRWVRRRADAPTGVFFKDPRPDGTRVHYYRRGSAASRMSAADAAGWPLESAAWVHVSGITPALSPDCSAVVDTVLDGAATHATTSLDVNYRPQLWPDRETAAHRLRALADRADVVLVGLDEAESLWGTTTAESVADLLDTTPCVVVKDADREAVELLRPVPGGAPTVTRVRARQVEVVEAVGAGDAFAAGYIAATLRGEPSPERLALGHSLAAWTLGTHADYRPGHGPSVRPEEHT